MFSLKKLIKNEKYYTVEIDWKNVPQDVANEFLFGLIIGKNGRINIEQVSKDFPSIASYIKVKNHESSSLDS